jgi:gamma-glutamylcyclotransferase (GGCT)/AIG2-like uncharacterized protein YtfP
MEGESKSHTGDAQGERRVDEELMYLYAYGSLLSLDLLRQFCPSATFVMLADLPNFQVQFRVYSEKRQGGSSCIVEAPGNLVRGVIYAIKKAEIHDLDILERVHQEVYTRETFLVLGQDNEWYEADLYRPTNPKGPYTPAKSYLDDMIEGAKAHGLDPEYSEKLVAWRKSID